VFGAGHRPEDDLIEVILAAADEPLDEHVDSAGRMVFDAPAHVVTAQG
jgi:hypothetical protein